MALYAKTKNETEEDTQLILQKGNEQRQLLIV
jgi:hypothetical protein